MVISDPFGSWVKGAHEGISDAIALRNAQDEAAQRAYNLQTQSQFDPLRYQLAQNQVATSGLELGANKDIYGAKNPQQLSQAAVERAQLGNVQGRVQLGDTGAYYPFATTHGGALTPEGGIQYQGVGVDQQPHAITTPYGMINNQQALYHQMQAMYQQARVQAQLRGQDIRAEDFEIAHGMAPGTLNSGNYGANSTGDVFGGAFNKPPAATQTAPVAPQFPNKPVDLHPSQQPTGSGGIINPTVNYGPVVEHGSVGVGGGSSFLGRRMSRSSLYGY